MKKTTLFICLLFSFPAIATKPDCHAWPMSMAQVWLQNAGIVAIAKIDESKTQFSLMASEKKKKCLYTGISFHF